MQSILLANIIHFIHILLLIFIIFGVFFIPTKYLLNFSIFIIIIIILWSNFIGACSLTQLEYYFRTGKWSNLSADDEGGPEFFRPLINSITGLELSRHQASILNYILFISAIIISIIKYYIFQK